MQQKNTDIHMKDQLLQRKLNGESVASIAADTGIPRSTVYSWIAAAREAREEDARKKGEKLALDPRSYYKLKERIEKLEGMVAVLKVVFDVSSLPLDKRLKVLEELISIIRRDPIKLCITRHRCRKKRMMLEAQ